MGVALVALVARGVLLLLVAAFAAGECWRSLVARVVALVARRHAACVRSAER